MVNYRIQFYRVEQIKKDISLRTRKLLERTVLIMEKIKLNVEHCKGCYLCIANCKPGALSVSSEVNAKGYLVPQVDSEKCVQCGCCYTMCPDLVFEIL